MNTIHLIDCTTPSDIPSSATEPVTINLVDIRNLLVKKIDGRYVYCWGSANGINLREIFKKITKLYSKSRNVTITVDPPVSDEWKVDPGRIRKLISIHSDLHDTISDFFENGNSTWSSKLDDTHSYYFNVPSIHTKFVPISFSPEIEKYVDLQCNGEKVNYTNMPEVRHLVPLFETLNPKNVLEIGAGIGRGSVYLKKRFQWDETTFTFLDGDEGDDQVCPVGSRNTTDFYNSHVASTHFCKINGLSEQNLRLLHPSKNWVDELNGETFDLVISFLAIGFHWSVILYLDDLVNCTHKGSTLVFGLRGNDRGREFAEEEIRLIRNHPRFKIINNYRDPEQMRSSVIVIRRI